MFEHNKEITLKKELKHLNDMCINTKTVIKTCNYRINNRESIEEIEDGFLLTKNYQRNIFKTKLHK